MPIRFLASAFAVSVLTGLTWYGPAAVAQTAAPVVAADPGLPAYVPTASVSGAVQGVAGMDSVEQMMKAYESSRTGRILDLETTFTPWWQAPEGIFDLKSGWE